MAPRKKTTPKKDPAPAKDFTKDFMEDTTAQDAVSGAKRAPPGLTPGNFPKLPDQIEVAGHPTNVPVDIPSQEPEPVAEVAPAAEVPAPPEETAEKAEEKPYIEMYLSKSRYLQQYGEPRPRMVHASPSARVVVRVPRYIQRVEKTDPEKGKLASRTGGVTMQKHPEDAHLKYKDPGDEVDVRPGVKKTGMPLNTPAPIIPPSQ